MQGHFLFISRMEDAIRRKKRQNFGVLRSGAHIESESAVLFSSSMHACPVSGVPSGEGCLNPDYRPKNTREDIQTGKAACGA